MNLDRSLIKSQARGLIKGNVFKFFVIIFVVTLLATGGNIYSASVNVANKVFEKTSNGYGLNNIDEYDFDDFVEGYDNQGNIENFGINDFEDFANQFGNSQKEEKPDTGKVVKYGSLGAFSTIWNIAMLFLAPLAITLVGVFYQLIKGRNLDWNEEFSFVFGKTFDKNYWNKFLLNLLKTIFMVLLCCLFIVPGIIFYYRYYFTSYIMADKPELSWKEAMHVSKKMTNGHKGELFVLDLSFIGWFLLMAITCGLVGIYVLPYVYTTEALYYENFKVRAFQLGVMSELDYLTEKEKAEMAYGNVQQQGYYQPPQAAEQQNYYQPAQPVQNVYQPVQENTYQPVQNNVYQPPVQQNTYQPVDYTYQKAENPVDTISQPPASEE